jgi:DNA (cytosine-5)-methyltransferase 1
MREVAALRVLDLFSGACGGWSLGLHRAGFKTVAACEFDPARRAAFAHNNPDVRMFDDVRNLTAARVTGALGYFPECVVGSPPCQDASAANHRGKGIDGARTGLFKDFVRIVGEGRPRWVAAENSPRLRTRGADWVLSAFEEIGYACWPIVVGALHARAPHERQRVWFIAADTDQIGVRKQPRRVSGQNRQGAAIARDAAAHDSDADREPEPDMPIHGEVGRELGVPAGNPDRQGLAVGQGERCDASAQLAALERAVGPVGAQWNGGPARHFGMAHGIPAGLARACVAAYGDAVVPQITEAIGRAILRTERLMEVA